MSTLGITLARGGSKGVPGKNIKSLAGLPLLAYTIMEAKRSKYLDEYVVSTDSPEIAAVAREYGARVVMRPHHLAEDSTPTLPALIHALEEVEAEDRISFDIIADLRCTNPLKTAYDIDGAIAKLIDTHADAVIGVCEVQDGHPARLKQIFRDRLVDIWPEPAAGNRQDLEPKVYIRNGSIYAVRRIALDEGVHIRLSDNVRPWIMPLERSINIDTKIDFLMAEILMERRNG